MKRILLVAIIAVAAVFWGASALADIPGSSSKVYIYFEANGGTGSMPKQPAKRYSAVTLKANKFKRAGYLFAGWRDKDTGRFYADKAQIDVYLGRMLVAQWIKDEYGWLDSAHVFAGNLYGDWDAPGTIILKTGKRNARTKVSKFSASVVWPGTTKKINMKGSFYDGFAELTGGGRSLYIEASDGDINRCWSDDDTHGYFHIAGKEGEACWIRGVFQPETYSCVDLPTISSNGARWTVPRNAAGLKLSFKKNTLEFTGSYTDMCDGRKVRMKVAGVAVDGGGEGYAYGDGNIYPFWIRTAWQ